ncbi:ddhd domain-containing protein [Phlyctema vagabunda]|uniref:Ddhd domain-containing protein n=1 Tax=Phlyctema vagabunda TaxID=108571 RepID=A0ABR4PF48_9HELO
MPPTSHTYGPTCHLAQSVRKKTSNPDDEIPDLNAQFFYSSPLPIDDPLSAAPAPTGSETTKYPPRPFSAYDNSILEESWLSLASEKDHKNHFKGKPPKWMNKHEVERRSVVPKRLSSRDGKTKQKRGRSKDNTTDKQVGQDTNKVLEQPSTSPKPRRIAKSESNPRKHGEPQNSQVFEAEIGSSKPAPEGNLEICTCDPCSCKDSMCNTSACLKSDCGSVACCASGKPSDVEEHTTHHQDKSRSQQKEKSQEENRGKDKAHDQLTKTVSSNVPNPEQQDGSHDNRMIHKEDLMIYPNTGKQHNAANKRGNHKVLIGQKLQDNDQEQSDMRERKGDQKHSLLDGMPTASGNTEAGPSRPLPSEPAGITGSPFARVPSRRSSPLAQAHNNLPPASELQAPPCDEFKDDTGHAREISDEVMQVTGCKAYRNSKAKDEVEVPVGISRLHLVKLPSLQMKPIYWSPVHDGAVVTRGTWFYKDTLLPVEPAVANQLEIGYRELRPWSQTWKDELNSAIDVGAIGEEKIVHRLWPKEVNLHEQKKDQKKVAQKEAPQRSTESMLSTDPFCAAKCFHGEAAAVGTLDAEKGEEATVVRRYPQSHVIYKDWESAFILKQSLVPSAYYGRKPLLKIMKGHKVGIHVVRGFDWKAWEKLHPPKKSPTSIQAEKNAPVTGTAESTKSITCPACRSHQERPKVTDLVLVIHGIGQKLSERVESFHFTHAINTFRRSVNVELGDEAVQPVLRKDLGGVMILPVNWRSNLSFEDGGPREGHDQNNVDSSLEDFTLGDITPDTIPAVRSLISDVMLDIPFYMSHHKPKMIEALITEANRVYTLWTKNNPGFEKSGRVHLIAHSLGSVMALDVLSKQPTTLPKPHSNKKLNTKYFDFDTTNLFFVGSPAGFFLLLEKGNLAPRRDRHKPGAELEDLKSGNGITAEKGTFGSLAVDNIYNIMHYNDPIAYRVNATVDPVYAASLKQAQVPSATTGWFEAIGKAIKSVTPGVSAQPDLAVGQLSKPAGIQRLPSQLEMEVHDFTREEIAEKKFYLLNDNGQVDWFLSSGGGPLEIQYLNMLGAHSSYWGSADFIRMLVTEVGRAPGKQHTLPNLRAVKAGAHKRK